MTFPYFGKSLFLTSYYRYIITCHFSDMVCCFLKTKKPPNIETSYHNRFCKKCMRPRKALNNILKLSQSWIAKTSSASRMGLICWFQFVSNFYVNTLCIHRERKRKHPESEFLLILPLNVNIVSCGFYIKNPSKQLFHSFHKQRTATWDKLAWKSNCIFKSIID